MKPGLRDTACTPRCSISWRRKNVMIDCGADWQDKVDQVNPNAILITHAHPDHACGLKSGAPCPVYATKECWSKIRVGLIAAKQVIEPRLPVELFGIEFEAFPVEHSVLAPAVGYRINAGHHSVFLYQIWSESIIRLRRCMVFSSISVMVPRSRARFYGSTTRRSLANSSCGGRHWSRAASLRRPKPYREFQPVDPETHFSRRVCSQPCGSDEYPPAAALLCSRCRESPASLRER